ncbi:hypothetical protein ZWY2020_009606 [Hordeum vulgare]|nr:hypothetical protein ZWY2020_009606 [Hordeum vulgare]
MGKAYHKKLGVHKTATAGTGAGKGKVMRAGKGKAMSAGTIGGAGGWGGASTFSAAEHSTFETVSWQTYRSLTITHSSTTATVGEGKSKGAGGGNAKRSGAIKGALFSPTAHGSFETDHSTFDTATQTMNEHYDEEENLGLTMDYQEDGMQDHELVSDVDAEGDDGSGGGGHDDVGVDDYDDVSAGSDHFRDDDYYYDDVVGGFDDGYDPGDAGDGADDWW